MSKITKRCHCQLLPAIRLESTQGNASHAYL